MPSVQSYAACRTASTTHLRGNNTVWGWLPCWFNPEITVQGTAHITQHTAQRKAVFTSLHVLHTHEHGINIGGSLLDMQGHPCTPCHPQPQHWQ
jgi:hypothetical protein